MKAKFKTFHFSLYISLPFLHDFDILHHSLSLVSNINYVKSIVSASTVGIMNLKAINLDPTMNVILYTIDSTEANKAQQ